MKKYYFGFRIVFALIIITSILSGCRSLPIEVEKFTGYTEVIEGEDATIEWSFLRADSVKIEGVWGTFESKDKYFVKPKQSKIYKVIAYKGAKDSVIMNAVVQIKSSLTKETTPGPAPLIYKPLSVSTNDNPYFTGLTQTEKSKNPASIKIMRTIYPYTQDNCLLRAVILDNKGNFVQGSSLKDKVIWTTTYECKKSENRKDIGNFTERDNSIDNYFDIAFVVDNSAAALENYPIVSGIWKFLPYLNPTDKVMLTTFNQNLNPVFKLESPEKANFIIQTLKLPPAEGLNSLYKVAYQSLLSLNSGENKNKIMVLITYNSDNSSIIYTSNSVAKLAHDNDIPIYIIGIGNSVESYFLKYLCGLTGGRYYYIADDETDKIPDILREIYYAQKYYYEFIVIPPTNSMNCSTLRTDVVYKEGDSKFADLIQIIPKPEVQYSRYQAVAVFNYREFEISPDFDNTINSLAKTLTDNPSALIELIGHSSLEGNNLINTDLSLKRAQEARRILIEKGVNASQIRVRAEGANKPIYYLQSVPWQQLYNRRVEVRWLDPSLLPYEIIAGKAKSEEEALAKVEDWEKRKLNSYYERYLQDNIPTYRVKLWGYKTIDEAETAAKTLSKKYSTMLVIE
ncbi:MAG: OmpA family protein [Bacteroidota bacterium]